MRDLPASLSSFKFTETPDGIFFSRNSPSGILFIHFTTSSRFRCYIFYNENFIVPGIIDIETINAMISYIKDGGYLMG